MATLWGNSDEYIQTIAVSGDGSTIYVGGSFSNVGGNSRKGFAAIDAITGEAR